MSELNLGSASDPRRYRPCPGAAGALVLTPPAPVVDGGAASRPPAPSRCETPEAGRAAHARPHAFVDELVSLDTKSPAFAAEGRLDHLDG